MTILDRETLIDRPELVDRDDDKDEQDEEQEEIAVIGEGGGLTAHGVEFEEDDLDIIAAANTCAVLTTGQEEGDVFEQMFANAAYQLKDLKERNRDVTMLSYFGLNNSIGTVGLTDEDSGKLMTQLMDADIEESDEEPAEPEEDEVEEAEEDGSIEDVEQEVEEMTEEQEDDGE